jgi:hypothetical protein
MAIALKLMDEFDWHSLAVLRAVAEVADAHPGGDPAQLESAARDRLTALLGRKPGPATQQRAQRIESNAPVPRQRAVS